MHAFAYPRVSIHRAEYFLKDEIVVFVVKCVFLVLQMVYYVTYTLM